MSKHEIIIGLPNIEPLRSTFEACTIVKQTRERAPCQNFHCSKTPLEIIHSDVYSPLFQPSFNGTQYILMFTDDCSHYGWAYFLKNKSDFLACFKISKLTLKNNLEAPFASFVMMKVVNTLLKHFVITTNNTISTNNLLN